MESGVSNPLIDSISQGGSDTAKQLREQLLASALAPVSDNLLQLQERIISFIPTQTKTTDDVLDHIFASGGKRIRPALFFFCSKMVNYAGDHLYPIAAVCEFVHAASLLHDDVVDNSTLRRNKPTANTIWGDQSSVLVGDLIYSRASEMMAATGSLAIVSTFARAIRLMSEGELIQLEQAFAVETSEEKYFQILENKTAVLIGASCKAAGLLAGRSEDEVSALEDFGLSLGVGFQLVDDALDYLGSRELFGKPTLSDLAEGKVTLPVILLRDVVNPDEKKTLEKILSKPEIAPEDIEVVAALVDTYKTSEQTIELAANYTDRALKALEVFPDSCEKEDLENIAKCLIWRFN